MAAPSMTYGAVGNVYASTALAAAAAVTRTSTNLAAMDMSATFGGRLTVDNTPGGTVAATRGLRIDCYRRYSTTTTLYPTLPTVTYTLPSAVASTMETVQLELDTGDWKVTLTNLDAANGVTVRMTLDIITAIS